MVRLMYKLLIDKTSILIEIITDSHTIRKNLKDYGGIRII